MAKVSTDSTPKEVDWPPWTEKWLKVFRDTGVARLACHACGINRSTPYALKDRDPAFAQAWEDAEQDAIDILEAEARNRARKGSDFLIKFLLQSLRPEVFRDVQRQELMFGRMSEDELNAFIAGELEKAAKKQTAGSRPSPGTPESGD